MDNEQLCQTTHTFPAISAGVGVLQGLDFSLIVARHL